jgi:hypothetical protein
MPPKRKAPRLRQAKLNFSSPVASPAKTPARNRKLVDSNSDADIQSGTTPSKVELERGMKMGMPVQLQKHGMFGSSDVESTSSPSSGSDVEEVAPPAKRRKVNKKPVAVVDLDSEEEASRPKKDTRGNKRKIDIQVFSSEVDSEEVISPWKVVWQGKNRSTKNAVAPTAEEMGEEGQGSKRSSKRISGPFKTHSEPISEEEEESEDEIQTPVKTRKQTKSRARKQAPVTEEDDENDEAADDNVEEQSADEKNHREKDDLKEDLEFLQSSPPKERDRMRSSIAKPMNERQRALAVLKARRAGSSQAPSSSAPAATPGRKRAIVLSDSDSDTDGLEVVKEEGESQDGFQDEEDEDEVDEPSETENQTNRFDMFYEDDEDQNFIDDNPNDIIGEPADLTAIPLQFTSFSRAKPRDLFKYVIEWMVQKKINPAFSSDDEIYTLAFRKLDDEVNGLANSKFSSSAWTPDFTRALRARPDLDLDEIPSFMRSVADAHCEACNRKSHPATFNAHFSGKPYNKETLEPLAEETDSSSDSDSSALSSESEDEQPIGEKGVYDAQGELLPAEDRIFTLGSTCKANAQMAHTLHHWRYHLNSWVVDYLVREKHCTPEKLAKRDKWAIKKRSKYANKIVDRMEGCGEIKRLYTMYKSQVDFAVEAKNEYRLGWGRNR